MRSQTLERDEARKKGAVSSALTASLQSPTSAKDFDHIQNHPSNGFENTDEPRRREDNNALGGIPIHKERTITESRREEDTDENISTTMKTARASGGNTGVLTTLKSSGRERWCSNDTASARVR